MGATTAGEGLGKNIRCRKSANLCIRLASVKGEPHERHLDFYRNFGGLGDSSGLRLTQNGHIHLNARRLSGDRQAQRENPAAPREALKGYGGSSASPGRLSTPAAANAAATPAQLRTRLRTVLHPGVQNGQKHPKNQKRHGRCDHPLNHTYTSRMPRRLGPPGADGPGKSVQAPPARQPSGPAGTPGADGGSPRLRLPAT